jgi:hypothetical protein
MADEGQEALTERIKETGLLIGHDYIPDESEHNDQKQGDLVQVLGLDSNDVVWYEDIFRRVYFYQEVGLFLKLWQHVEGACSTCYSKEKMG